MGKSQHLIDTANKIIRLTPEQCNDPASVVAEFFLNYHLHDVRTILWQWLWAGVANSNGHFTSAIERSDLLFLYENLERLIEANYLLKKRADAKKHKKNRASRY